MTNIQLSSIINPKSQNYNYMYDFGLVVFNQGRTGPGGRAEKSARAGVGYS